MTDEDARIERAARFPRCRAARPVEAEYDGLARAWDGKRRPTRGGTGVGPETMHPRAG